MKHKKESKTILKPYFIILLIIIICFPLLKFSSNLNEKIKLFLDNKLGIFFGRKLNFYTDSLKVCSRSSENLAKYFETGDTQYVELYEYKNEEEPSNFTLQFIKILSGDSNEEETKNTLLAHYALASFFFIASFLSIPGWIVCCSCSCCKCYCCCCVKQPKYRLPFFIISSILNFIIMVTCIAGLSKTNAIFKGLTNAECSILRFINEILDGETKNTLPKWGGIDDIINMFQNTIIQIEKMGRDDTQEVAQDKSNQYNTIKGTFENSLKTACQAISDEANYIYEGYKLDLANKFGVYETDHFTYGSYADKWSQEAMLTDTVQASYNALGIVIATNVATSMGKAIEFIQIMNDGIEGFKDLIGEMVLEYSEMLDEYGKLVFRLVFGILLFIAVLLECLLVIFIFFSSSKHTKCLIRFISKIFIHIIWNIFALMMIIMFFFGSIMTFVGMVGEDLFQMISFLISKRNLQSDSPMILDSGTSFINVCINGDGIIADELGIESDLGKIDLLKTYTNQIDSIIIKITENIENPIDLVYNELLLEYNIKKAAYNFELIKKDSDGNEEKISLLNSLKSLNDKLKTCSINERWSFLCEKDFPSLTKDECQSTTSDSNKCIDPMSCNNELNNRYSSSCSDADNFGKIVNKITAAIKYIDNSNNGNSILKQGRDVNAAYRTYLTDAKTALDGYTLKFTPLTALYDNFVGNGSIMGFINCAFLGKNVKVMLKYLDDSVGNQFKSLGITVLANGVAMAFSICFIILLVIIVNSTVKLREMEKEMVSPFDQNGSQPQINDINLMQRPNILPPISQNNP